MNFWKYIKSRFGSVSKRSLILYAFLIASGVALRFMVARLSPEKMNAQGFPDDAFFYLRIAEQIATGHGSTFDGVHLTNGYHPLWVMILVFLYRLFPDFHGAYFHAVVVTGMLLNLATAFFLWKTIRLYSRRGWLAPMGLVLFLFNPALIFYSMNGMETSLHLFLFSVLSYLFLKARMAGNVRPRSFVMTGIIAGLFFLARTDSILITIPILTVLFVVERHRRIRVVGLLLTPLIIIAFTYFLWSFYFLHSFVQINSYAPTVIRLMRVGINLPPYKTLAEFFGVLKFSLWTLRQDIESFTSLVPLAKLVPPLLGATYVLGMIRTMGNEKSEFLRPLRFLAVPVASLLLSFVVNSAIRFNIRGYYLVPWIFIIILLITLVINEISIRQLRAWRAAVACLLFFVFIIYFFSYWDVYRPATARIGNSSIASQIATTWANANLPDGSRIGSFGHSGVATFWSKHHVENLDGKINNAVYPFLIDGSLYEYLKENRITYLLDPTSKLESKKPFFRKTPEFFETHIKQIYEVNESTVGFPIQNVGIWMVTF